MSKAYAQRTLEELRAAIATAAPHVGKKGAPHAIDNVAQALRMISARHGVDEANKAIRDFNLTKLGWEEQEGEEADVNEPVQLAPIDMVDPLVRVNREG